MILHKHKFMIPIEFKVVQNHHNTEGRYIKTEALIATRFICRCGKLSNQREKEV